MDIEEYSNYTQFYTLDIPNLLLRSINEVNWKTYLDLGCGDGALLYALNQKGYFNNKIIYAVDLSITRINLVKKISKDFKCFVNDACNLKHIQDDSIDFLISTGMIEHVSNDEDMVKEISRVIKRNGTVYLSTIFKKDWAWYFYKCNGKPVIDPTHIREYTRNNKLLHVLKEYNFEVIENKRSLMRFSMVNFMLRRIHKNNHVHKNHLLELISRFKVPIFGYYNWELVCKKD